MFKTNRFRLSVSFAPRNNVLVMQRGYEEHYHSVEADHWWFVARRRVVRDLVLRRGPDRSTRVLELGCSAGLLMQRLLLDGYKTVRGIDISADAINRCRAAGLDAQVMDAQKLTFPDESFDLLTASDVLEHLPDEAAALREWRRILKPGGVLIVFVPAFMFLWTEHDVVNNHCRRYTRATLVRPLAAAGFHIERSSYWNTALFPAVAIVRVLKRCFGQQKVADAANVTGDMFALPAPLNRALLGLLQVENRFLKWGVNWPFGVSVMAVAKKTGN